MRNWRVFFWIGLGSFVLGGVLLAFDRNARGTAVGTTLGMGGLGLMVWAWIRRRAAADR
jgi:ABC-type phosphate/phosphonate transport system permease subunit